MTAAQEELFDLAILRVLDKHRGRYGLTVAAIGHMLAEFGFPSPNKDSLLDRVDYLTGKELVEEVSKVIGNANRAWRITEAGLQYVDQRG
jgi:hypothetical protein